MTLHLTLIYMVAHSDFSSSGPTGCSKGTRLVASHLHTFLNSLSTENLANVCPSLAADIAFTNFSGCLWHVMQNRSGHQPVTMDSSLTVSV